MPLYARTSGIDFIVISFAVSEILGGVCLQPPDATKLFEKADAINR